MRADRLLSILLLLQVHRRLTAGELAERLEVSERTIHRDMEALSVAGVPVIAERGRGGGWRLLEPYRTNLTGLKETEIQALVVATPPRVLADLGLEAASESALIKLLAALPSMRRVEAEFARQRIHIDGAGWYQRDEPVPALPVVQEAIWQERRLRFRYRRGDDETGEREVDPLGLVAKGSLWYLIAGIDGVPRTYRVSRISDPILLDEPAERPDDFDLAAHWRESSAAFLSNLPRYQVIVRAAPEVMRKARRLGRFPRILSEGPVDDDGWTRLELQFDVEWEACEFILSQGPLIELLEPAALRERVRHAAEGIVVLYETCRSHQGDLSVEETSPAIPAPR